MDRFVDFIKEIISYDPETGALTWRERGRHLFTKDRDWHWWNKRFSGREAGTIRTLANGYQRRSFRATPPGGKIRTVMCHRAAWIIMTGEVPVEIDHINGDALDNRWVNLREVDREANCRNRAISSRNTSGVVGVNWSKQCKKWRAEYHENGKNVYIGLFETIESAALAIEKARGAVGYSARHGDVAPYK